MPDAIAAEKRIKDGAPAVRAVNGAIDQFVEMFTKLGGLMAERVTDLRDVRDRVVAELLGGPEPGVPTPESSDVTREPGPVVDDLPGVDRTGTAGDGPERDGPVRAGTAPAGTRATEPMGVHP